MKIRKAACILFTCIGTLLCAASVTAAQTEEADYYAKNLETGEVISSTDQAQGQITMNAGNPGGMPEIAAGETDEEENGIRKNGNMRGMLPESILNADRAFSFDFSDGVQYNTVFGGDDRIWLDYSTRTTYPYCAVVSAVSYFPNGDCRVGTAVVVDHYTLLTCGHCVYDPSRGGWADAVDLIPGRDNDSWPYGSTYASYMLVPGKYYNNLEWTYDFAILNTPDDLGSKVGWFGMSWQTASLDGQTVETVGYPASTMAEMKTSGTIDESGTEYLHFKLDTSGGQSGSPLYRWESDGWPHVLGLVRGEDDVTNYGVRLTETKFDFIMENKY